MQYVDHCFLLVFCYLLKMEKLFALRQIISIQYEFLMNGKLQLFF